MSSKYKMEEDFEMDSSDSSDEDKDREIEADTEEKLIEKEGDSEDDSDSDEEREEIKEVDEDAVMERLAVIDAKLLTEPYSYDLYVEKISLYKSIGDLDELRKSREKLCELYPLSAALWLEWILDEQKLSATDEEKENISTLFNRATKDYLSVEVWLEYTKFHLSDLMNADNGIEKCRNLFEKALSSCGLHAALGSLIWDAYRDFEAALLGLAATEDEMTAQENRYLSVCRRQLSVPLLKMENTYKQLSTKIDLDEATKSGYELALKKLQQIKPWENKLLASETDEEKILIYKDYIAYEKSAKSNPARILGLYERAVADHPLDGSLWGDYIDYVVQRLQVDEAILDVSKRASRNCPWVLDIWIKYLKNVESRTEGNDKVKEVFEQSLLYCSTGEQAGTMWLKYLESLTRRVGAETPNEKDVQLLRNTFEAAETHLLQLLVEPNEYICQILMFHARFEAHHEQSMVKSRELWEDIFKRGYGEQFRVWNQYIMLERQYADIKTLRAKLSKAMGYVKDDPASISDLWLNVERDFGDVKSLELCEQKIAKQMGKFYENAAATAVDSSYSSTNYQDNKSNWKSWKKESTQIPSGSKRKFSENRNSGGYDKSDRKYQDGSKTKKMKPSYDKEDVPDGSKRADHEFKQPKLLPPKAKADPVSTEGEIVKESSTQSSQEVKHDSSLDNFTVFLSNLAYTSGEYDIREFFQDTGVIRDIRLVKDYKGQSKGFAYVVFQTIEEAQKALTKDREPLNSRPAFISKCDPDKATRRVQFKYPASLERNKLFVKGLPFSYTVEQVKTLFSQYGALKDARVVTFRNGHSKGIAYVDFVDESSSSVALLKTDGMTIEDKVISVEISNPPSKQTKPVFNEFLTPSQVLAGRRKIGTFVPRSLQVSSSKPTPATSTAGQNDAGAGDSTATNAPKTNQQFRELFAKKL